MKRVHRDTTPQRAWPEEGAENLPRRLIGIDADHGLDGGEAVDVLVSDLSMPVMDGRTPIREGSQAPQAGPARDPVEQQRLLVWRAQRERARDASGDSLTVLLAAAGEA
jgi:CheY-like chemotaxis protein